MFYIYILLNTIILTLATDEEYLAECIDEDVVERCQGDPIINNININDDHWRSYYKLERIPSPDVLDATGLDTLTSYTRHSWSASPGLDVACYFTDKENTSYICQSEVLTDLGQIDFPQNLKYLKINGSGIRNIPRDVFKNHNITALIINGNKQMEKIFPKSFNGIHGLQYLYMNGNEMIKWPLIEDSFFYIFHKAIELRHLVLESNNITFKGK